MHMTDLVLNAFMPLQECVGAHVYQSRHFFLIPKAALAESLTL